MTLATLATEFKSNLSIMYGDEEASALFLMAIEYELKLARSAYQTKKTEEIHIDDELKLKKVLNELLTGKPIQYILGEAYFYGLKFKVNPSVLIPRPETEELVAWILEKISSSLPIAFGISVDRADRQTPDAKRLSILDIGTGSGCIAISLKKNLPLAQVYALDISSESIVMAKENAVLNNVEVEFIQQDILQTQHAKLNTPISIVVSNPPYIKADEKLAMHQNVLAYEPHEALFVSNEDPLVFYRAIADFALKNLMDGGLLFFEINEYLCKETVDLLKRKNFKNIELKKDLQGKYRMIKAEQPPAT